MYSRHTHPTNKGQAMYIHAVKLILNAINNHAHQQQIDLHDIKQYVFNPTNHIFDQSSERDIDLALSFDKLDGIPKGGISLDKAVHIVSQFDDSPLFCDNTATDPSNKAQIANRLNSVMAMVIMVKLWGFDGETVLLVDDLNLILNATNKTLVTSTYYALDKMTTDDWALDDLI